MRDRRTPVVVVTGFLGSGKTTLLSRLLRDPELGETAVIVNELGEVAIDHHLLRRVDERTVVLSSGCVCCSLRGDLADELRDLLARRASGELPPFRRIAVETTGLADPAPILATLVSDPMLRHQLRLAVAVATVDAVNGARTLDRHTEAVRQVAAADRIVVTKPDLADPAPLVERLRALNPGADVVRASFGDLAPRRLLRPVRADRVPLAPEAVPHGDVRATALTFDEPLDWVGFGVWLTMLLQARGQDVLRVKGLLDTGGPGPVVLDGVQHVVHPPRHLPDWPDGDRRTRLVVIARGVDAGALERSLRVFAGGSRSRLPALSSRAS
jgi:G3E family GTPase